MSIILIILIVIFASAASFLPSTGTVYDNSNRARGIKKIRTRGWLTIGFYLGTILLTYVQYRLTETESIKKEKLAKEESDKRDARLKSNSDSSLFEMKKKFDTTTINIFEQLAKYGFKVDSANNRLVEIVKDSSKTKIILSEKPFLALCSDNGIEPMADTNNNFRYRVNFCSRDASSKNFQVKCKIAIIDTLDNLKYVGEIELLSSEMRISKDKGVTTILLISKIFSHKLLYILIKGTYTNYDGSESFPVDELYIFNKTSKITDKGFAMPIREQKKAVVDKMK